MASEYTKAYSSVISKVMKSDSPEKQNFISHFALTIAAINAEGWFGAQTARDSLMNLATHVGLNGDKDLDFVLRRSEDKFQNTRY